MTEGRIEHGFPLPSYPRFCAIFFSSLAVEMHEIAIKIRR